jgi:ubiquinone/menaquinone biosynthesis C-methylase UbiE
MEMEYLYELFSEMPRQGPGTNECTRKAFGLLKELPAEPVILDVGCGAGMQTLELARISGGSITALDNYQPFLDDLYGCVRAEGLENVITTVNGSMFELPFEKETFDLIWAEGSIYIIGFEQGLRDWKPLLKRGGYMVVSEMTWLRDGMPDEIRAYMDEVYPVIKTSAENIDIIRQAGYTLVNSFPLPEAGWWDDFYIPLGKRIELLRGKYSSNEKAMEVLNASVLEIEMYKKYSDYYGYIFYVMQAR